MSSDINARTYVGGAAVTPSDAAIGPANPGDPAGPFAGFYAGGAGNITVIDMLGNTTLYTALIVGQHYPFAFKQVKITGTTATLIVGLNADPGYMKRRTNP